MNRLDDMDELQARPVKPPFKTDQEQSQALKQLFDTELGKRVLQSIKYDMGYYVADLPGGKDVPMQMAFNAGKKFVINHIDTAMTVEYEKVNKLNLED